MKLPRIIVKWLDRSTAFAGFFIVTAYLLALQDHLTWQYVSAGSVLQALITGRAVAADQHEREMAKLQKPAPSTKEGTDEPKG